MVTPQVLLASSLVLALVSWQLYRKTIVTNAFRFKSLELPVSILVWLSVLVVGLTLAPGDRFGAVHRTILVIWAVLAVAAVLATAVRHGFKLLMQGGELPVAFSIYYYLAYVELPGPIRPNVAFVLRLGLRPRAKEVGFTAVGWQAVKMRIETQPTTIVQRKYGEEAIVEGAGLDKDSVLTIAPWSSDCRYSNNRIDVRIQDLVHRPVELAFECANPGSHIIQFEFLDQDRTRRGAITVPIDSKVRFAIPRKVWLVVGLIACMVGLLVDLVELIRLLRLLGLF